MSEPMYDVVVGGASYTGLATAIALAQSLPGIRVAVLDGKPRPVTASASPRPDPRAFALSAASRHLLEALGAWPLVAAESQPVIHIEITDSELDAGIRPTLLTYANLTDTGEAASHIVPGDHCRASRRRGGWTPLHTPGGRWHQARRLAL